MAVSRRSFLALTALAGAARLEGGPAGRKGPPSPEEFRRRLVGPILSNPTPFKANFEVDYQGLRNIIARALGYGVPIFASTAGNSQYDSLTYEEIKEVTRVLVEAVGGRGLTIAATGGWWTAQVVDYCRFAAAVGADAVQVLAP